MIALKISLLCLSLFTKLQKEVTAYLTGQYTRNGWLPGAELWSKVCFLWEGTQVSITYLALKRENLVNDTYRSQLYMCLTNFWVIVVLFKYEAIINAIYPFQSIPCNPVKYNYTHLVIPAAQGSKQESCVQPLSVSTSQNTTNFFFFL